MINLSVWKDYWKKMIKIQEDSEKSSKEVELKIFEIEERRQKESQDFQMRLLSLLQAPNIQLKSRTYKELQICKPKAFHVICTVIIIYIQTPFLMMTIIIRPYL